MDQQIALGSAVVGSDGRPVGKVTRVVLSPDDRELLEIIVRAGHLLHADRIVEMFQIERVEDGVVHLALRADEVSRLPRLIYHEYVVPAPRESRTGPYPISGSVAGGLTTPGVWGSNYSGEGFHTVNRSFFESAPIDSAAVELRSNLPADSVALGRGAVEGGSPQPHPARRPDGHRQRQRRQSQRPRHVSPDGHPGSAHRAAAREQLLLHCGRGAGA